MHRSDILSSLIVVFITLAEYFRMSDESKDDEVLEVIIDGRRGKLYRTAPDGRIPHGAIKVNKNSLANLRFDALRKRPLEER